MGYRLKVNALRAVKGYRPSGWVCIAKPKFSFSSSFSFYIANSL